MSNRFKFSAQLLAIVFTSVLFGRADGQVNFTFNYNDAAGVGFNHATLGAQRRAALQQSADRLAGYFANYTATINIDVDGSASGGGFLAGASANYNSPYPGPGFGDRGDVMVKILNGDAADPAAGTADGSVIWNFADWSWEYGRDFQPGEFDFQSTAIHELMHTVGFLSGITQSGDDLWGTPSGTPSTWEPFDEFVSDNTGRLIDGSTFIIDGSRWSTASTGGTGANGLFFDGPNAIAANGGMAVNLYSPSTWEQGSSGVHLDDEIYNGTYVMEAAVAPGEAILTLSGLEVAMLKDIGYSNILAVPEPGSISILSALAMIALIRRRRS